MAQVVHIDAKPSVRKQILRELQIMHDCVSLVLFLLCQIASCAKGLR